MKQNVCEYPCWDGGVYIETAWQDDIRLKKRFAVERKEKIAAMNSIKRFFWRLLIND